MQEGQAVQEAEAVHEGEEQVLSAKLKMQKDLASEANILSEHEVETPADRHLSAQVVPLDNAFSTPSPQLQGS